MDEVGHGQRVGAQHGVDSGALEPTLIEPSPRGVVEGLAAAAGDVRDQLPEQGRSDTGVAGGTRRMTVEWNCGRGRKACGAPEKGSGGGAPIPEWQKEVGANRRIDRLR
ncbi:MAG: hypothetical protein M3495_11495 [Pseudomonadota bacterium]|nr:hypothetical protein [Pseudomonadota bacterium]